MAVSSSAALAIRCYRGLGPDSTAMLPIPAALVPVFNGTRREPVNQTVASQGAATSAPLDLPPNPTRNELPASEASRTSSTTSASNR